MFIQIFDRLMPFLKRDKQPKGKVCPNGHVMHPSWDVCPYCQEMQAMMAAGKGEQQVMPMGQGTAMLNVSEMGGLLAFTHAPGMVLRCPACEEVMVRIVQTPGGIYLDARGAAHVRLAPSAV